MKMGLRNENTISEYGKGIRVYSRLRELSTVNGVRREGV